MNCTPLTWSPSTADALGSTLIVCTIAVAIHIIFWAQLIIFPSLRQRNMMWLYAYLITDFCLLARFFILYNIRKQHACLYPTFRTIMCYFEASSKFYMNAVQTYILLALNLCRFAQIVFNRNVFTKNPRLIILIHFLIGFLPAINVMVQFLADWTLLWRRTGASCDIEYESLIVQIFNLFVIYIIPIVFNLIIIGFCIRYVSSIRGVCSQQIINRRRKRQRTLLFQTITFYSIWLVLWSPNVLAFQFINVNTEPGIYTSLLNYVEIAIDPIIIAVIDVRFYKAWQKLCRRIRGRRQVIVAPRIAAIIEQVH
jgi:hypothetical protein